LANKVSDNNQKKSYHVMLLTPAWWFGMTEYLTNQGF
jgi:hypothetical protein